MENSEPSVLEYISAFQDVKDMQHDRYASFDYCFTYFHTHQGTAGQPENLALSCFILWSYLASWGMLRGSSQLLQKNPHYLTRLIHSIDQHKILYEENHDIDKWLEPDVLDDILDCYNDIEKALKEKEDKEIGYPGFNPSITLITKIMLGVYGCIPAFDQYFKKAFDLNVQKLKKEHLKLLRKDDRVKELLNSFGMNDNRPFALDYNSNTSTEIRYSKAKMVDMYGFTAGLVLSYKAKSPIKDATQILKMFKNGRLIK